MLVMINSQVHDNYYIGDLTNAYPMRHHSLGV